MTLRSIDRNRSSVSVEDIVEIVGVRSFGPVLLVSGLVTLAPLIGDIPGVPTLMAVLVIVVAAQLLAGRDRVWLPQFLRKRAVQRSSLDDALDALDRPAAMIDRMFKPRLTVLVTGAGSYLIGGSALLVAAIMPLLEFIPFSATIAGAALTAFGLCLISRDGYLAIVSLAATTGVIVLAVRYLASL